MTGPALHPPAPVSHPGPAAHAFAPFGDDGLTFADLLDVVNPLQHVPLLGGLYRRLTGDALSPAARVLGGALFGGPIGAIAAAATAAIEHAGATRVAGGSAGIAAREAPGGWIVNAARPRQGGPAGAPGTSIATAPAAGSERARPRPGGWMVNAAYAGRDAVERRRGSIDVAA